MFYRPAAIDQLGIVADQVGVSVYEDREEKKSRKNCNCCFKKSKKR
ncbi:MAG: hypothetical protein ACJ0P4_03170 [Flavobacteriaceae bacterium]